MRNTLIALAIAAGCAHAGEAERVGAQLEQINAAQQKAARESHKPKPQPPAASEGLGIGGMIAILVISVAGLASFAWRKKK